MTPPSRKITISETPAHRAVALVLTASLAVIIGLLTLTPSQPHTPPFFTLPDKVYHAIAFATLILPTALLAISILSWVLAAALVYGGLIELIQPQVGRSSELGDMVANMVGLCAGLAIGWGLRRLYRKRLAARGLS